MTTRRTFLSGLAAAGGSAMLLSGAADPAAEKGRKILDEALAALGGDAFLHVKDRLEEGRAYSFYNDKLTGLSKAKIYTRNLDQPSKEGLAVIERQIFGKTEDSSIFINEHGEGWELTFRGARPLPADTLQRYADSTPRSVLYIMRHRLKEPGLIIESTGSEVLVNEPVNVVDITDSQNRTTTVYFHYSTKLPIRQKFYRRDLKTKDRFEEVSLFSKFRDIGGGAKWPFAIRRERDGEKIFEIFSEKVVANPEIQDSIFALPEGVRMLNG